MPKFAIRCLFTIVLCFLFGGGYAQFFSNKNGWKKQREEIIWGIGVANFLGDLGGRNAIGTDYSPIDLEFALTRPSAMVGYRYRLSKKFSLKLEASFLRVWGNDKLTTEAFRNNRNLNFRSNIFEGSGNIEYAIFREKKGNKYHIKHTFKRRQKAYSTYFYLFAGVGGFWFNPKTKYQNSWVALKPFATEGHNYKRISICIPMGVGYKVTLSQQWAVGFEFTFRKTFTDYIDDVSDSYVDNTILLQTKGAVAAAVADPNLGNFPVQLDAYGKSKEGMQRGDKRQKDSYMNFVITGGYFLKAKKARKKTRAKF